ncbi:hypothetical protein BU23DRAFT_493979, partial [Bimuria novae-zelandiae CBS 107.79]
APPKFIHYEPTPLGILINTMADLGLQISNNIPIPRDSLIQPNKLLKDGDIYRLVSTLALLAVDDVEAAIVINKLKASDREQTNERIKYE